MANEQSRRQTERQSEGDALKCIANRTEVNAVLRGTRWDSAATT